MDVYMLFCIILILVPVKAQLNCNIQNDADPCYRYGKTEIPLLDTRHPDVRFGNATSDHKYCDLYALRADIWYIGDYPLTNYCVQHDSCGSRHPIWLNGTMPTADQGISSFTGCVKDYDECCWKTYRLRIKNCVYYYVYCFIDLPTSCPQRYCFDIDKTRVTTPATSTSTFTTTQSTLMSSTTQNEFSTVSGNYGHGPSSIVITLSLLTGLSLATVIALAGVIVFLKVRIGAQPIADKKIMSY